MKKMKSLFLKTKEKSEMNPAKLETFFSEENRPSDTSQSFKWNDFRQKYFLLKRRMEEDSTDPMVLTLLKQIENYIRQVESSSPKLINNDKFFETLYLNIGNQIERRRRYWLPLLKLSVILFYFQLCTVKTFKTLTLKDLYDIEKNCDLIDPWKTFLKENIEDLEIELKNQLSKKSLPIEKHFLLEKNILGDYQWNTVYRQLNKELNYLEKLVNETEDSSHFDSFLNLLTNPLL